MISRSNVRAWVLTQESERVQDLDKRTKIARVNSDVFSPIGHAQNHLSLPPDSSKIQAIKSR